MLVYWQVKDNDWRRKYVSQQHLTLENCICHFALYLLGKCLSKMVIIVDLLHLEVRNWMWNESIIVRLIFALLCNFCVHLNENQFHTMAKASKSTHHTWGRSFSERVRGFGLPFEDRFRSIRKKKVKGK